MKASLIPNSFTNVDWQVDINVIHNFLVNSREPTLSVLRNSGKDYEWKFFSFTSQADATKAGPVNLCDGSGNKILHGMGTNGCPDLGHISEGIELLSFLYPTALFRKGQ